MYWTPSMLADLAKASSVPSAGITSAASVITKLRLRALRTHVRTDFARLPRIGPSATLGRTAGVARVWAVASVASVVNAANVAAATAIRRAQSADRIVISNLHSFAAGELDELAPTRLNSRRLRTRPRFVRTSAGRR